MSVTRALLLGPLVTTIVTWPSPALYAQDLEFRVGPGGVGIYDRNRERRGAAIPTTLSTSHVTQDLGDLRLPG